MFEKILLLIFPDGKIDALYDTRADSKPRDYYIKFSHKTIEYMGFQPSNGCSCHVETDISKVPEYSIVFPDFGILFVYDTIAIQLTPLFDNIYEGTLIHGSLPKIITNFTFSNVIIDDHVISGNFKMVVFPLYALIIPQQNVTIDGKICNSDKVYIIRSK